MKKTMQISVPEPCHENWDAMTPTSCGRFCGSCQKVVVDFTTMTDAQILDVFKKAGDATPCGHFLETQLNRTLMEPKPQSIWRRLAGRAAAIVLLVQSATLATAQQKKLAKVTGIPPKPHQPVTAKKPVREICGRVVDDRTGSGVEGMIVTIEGTTLQATSLAGGIFRIGLPDSFYMQQMTLYVKRTAEDENKEWYQYDNYQLSWNDMLAGREVLLPRYKAEVLPQHTIMERPAYRTYTGIAPHTYTEPARSRKHWFKRKKNNG